MKVHSCCYCVFEGCLLKIMTYIKKFQKELVMPTFLKILKSWVVLDDACYQHSFFLKKESLSI
jgi:hypothetical protein